MQMRFLLTLFAACALLGGCARAPVSRPDMRVQPLLQKKQLAFVNAPVIDVLGTGPTKSTKSHSESRYHHLPCGYITAHHRGAPRIHQLLLNQIVYIKAEKPYETLIEVPGIQIGSGGKIINISGWVQKKYLTPIEVLQKKRHAGISFPDPLHILKRPAATHIALIHPYHIPQYKRTLSAGTLFALVKEHKHTYFTHIWDEDNLQFRLLAIPKTVAIAQVPLTREQAVKQYIALLRFWANQQSGFIPYVLGGGSWIGNYTEKKFQKKGEGGAREYYRSEEVGSLQSGFDCTTLIYNAARINNIPFFCRNTTAISKTLHPIKPHEPIESGDLILFPGHVVVISSTNPLTLIQARGYGAGYGRILEGPAAEHFKDIHTLSDLKKHLSLKKPLYILDSNKKLYDTRKQWAIYRFKSCWKTPPSKER